MGRPQRVLLKYLGICLAEGFRESTDFAVLGGTMAVILGSDSSAADLLAKLAAGISTPWKGKVLTGSGMHAAASRDGLASTGYITSTVDAPPGMTVRGCVSLAVTATGKKKAAVTRHTEELLEWLELKSLENVPVETLTSHELQRTAMAIAMAGEPELLVVGCPVHESLHRKLAVFAEAGNAVVLLALSLGQIPAGAERIALCDSQGIRCIVRHSELASAALGGAEIKVSFYPSLPRKQLEKIEGIRNLINRNGYYSFSHEETTHAVTQLMHIARANSRAVVGLELLPLPPDTLIRMFEPSEAEEAPRSGLFDREEEL